MPAFACALLLGISLQVAPLNVPASPVYALVGVDEDPGGLDLPIFASMMSGVVGQPRPCRARSGGAGARALDTA